jgi:tripartite-type tricarboxylate transporter receptor subunit TctC
MDTLTKRSFLLGALATPLAARAQAWPADAIRIVVPYPLAGSTDVIARLVQPELQQRLGATVIVENRPRASATLGTAVNDLILGHVDLLVGSTALSVPQIQAETIRAVAQTGKTRTPMLGEVQTVAESGFPGFEAYAWWGVFAPAGTPPEVISRFGAALDACLREPRVADQLTQTQQLSLKLGGPEDLRTFLAEQMRVWGAVARENSIKAD